MVLLMAQVIYGTVTRIRKHELRRNQSDSRFEEERS